MEECYQNIGFMFDYKNKRLVQTRAVLPHEVEGLPRYKRNLDDVPLYVYCVGCEEFMDFAPNGDMSGNWVCPECGSRVRERTVYARLDRENEQQLIREIEPPECCISCGGPWPSCEKACPIFDD